MEQINNCTYNNYTTHILLQIFRHERLSYVWGLSLRGLLKLSVCCCCCCCCWGVRWESSQQRAETEITKCHAIADWVFLGKYQKALSHLCSYSTNWVFESSSWYTIYISLSLQKFGPEKGIFTHFPDFNHTIWNFFIFSKFSHTFSTYSIIFFSLS